MKRCAVGLDWVGNEVGWAFCRVGIDGGNITFGTVPADNPLCSPIVHDAVKIVVDAPIGLPDGSAIGCKCRPCDLGAKAITGAELLSSVFPVPYRAELDEWRRRREERLAQQQGHFRGLLPAIHSADLLRQARAQDVAESHPEVVVALMSGGWLPKKAGKKTLFGSLVRLGALHDAGLTVSLADIASLPTGKGAADDYLDAAIMAVVAQKWAQRRDVGVIKSSAGHIESFSDASLAAGHLMMVPWAADTEKEAPRELGDGKLLMLADKWAGIQKTAAQP